MISIDLGNVGLDEFGRVMLSDEILEGFETNLAIATAGAGSNNNCPGTINNLCNNTVNCINSTNQMCTNAFSCESGTNSTRCDRNEN